VKRPEAQIHDEGEWLRESIHTLLKEKPNLIPALKEIIIAHMILPLSVLAASGELGHRMVLEGEVLEQCLRFEEQ
jgi:hypothetical protein